MTKKKKVCKKCKIFVEDDKCPICKGNQFVENWKGRIIVLDTEKSQLAKKMDIKKKGIYAIKA